jgi:hypothetical protein
MSSHARKVLTFDEKYVEGIKDKQYVNKLTNGWRKNERVREMKVGRSTKLREYYVQQA